MKDSFLMYASMKEVLLALPDAELRQMTTAIFDYNSLQKTPEFTGTLKAVWEFFKSQFDRDSEKYQVVCERNRKNGGRGGRPKKTQRNPENPVGFLETQKTQRNPEKPKKPDTDTDTDTDIKESILADTKEKPLASSLQSKSSFKRWSREELQAEIQRYPEHCGIVGEFLDYWTEPAPSGKMRFQLEQTWETGRRLKRWAAHAVRSWANAGTPPPVCDPFSKDEKEARRKELGAFE